MTVLACVDGSRYLASVCEYAPRAAQRLDTGVQLLQAIEHPLGGEVLDRSGLMTAGMADTTLEESTSLHEERNRLARAQGRVLLEHAETLVRSAGIESVQERLVFGSLVDSIREHEEGVRLIVMGKRGEAEKRASAHLGSNLERVVRASPHPVLIVPAESRPLHQFVVAFDGGPSSMKVVDVLSHETLLLEAECQLLMAGPDDEEHRQRLTEATIRLRAAGYRVAEILEPGHADEVILARIHDSDADLLVMGAYGHSRIREMIIGSTTTTLLRASPVPVLVIR